MSIVRRAVIIASLLGVLTMPLPMVWFLCDAITSGCTCITNIKKMSDSFFTFFMCMCTLLNTEIAVWKTSIQFVCTNIIHDITYLELRKQIDICGFSKIPFMKQRFVFNSYHFIHVSNCLHVWYKYFWFFFSIFWQCSLIRVRQSQWRDLLRLIEGHVVICIKQTSYV